MRHMVVYTVFGMLVAASGAFSLVGNADLVGPLSVVEGEARTRDAGYCTPDGESMRVVNDASRHGGAALEFPHDGCWAEWTLTLGETLKGLVIGSSPPTGGGSGVRECAVWQVVLDGTVAGATAAHCGENSVGQPAELAVTFSGVTGNLLLPGTHTVRVSMDVTLGPDWANAYVDYLGLSLDPCGLINRAPAVPVISVNGFDDGHFAWIGLDYVFRVVSVSDPDGDPIKTLAWTFADGATAQGTQVQHRFGAAAVRDVLVVATDDPSLRNRAGCPLLSALSTVSSAWRLTITPDWTVNLLPATTSVVATDPAKGCVVAQQAPAPRTVAGRCVFGAAVDVKSARPGAVSRVDFLLETDVFGSSAATPYQGVLKTLDHTLGDHTLTAKVTAKNDVHARSFATAGYAFLNA